MAGILSDRSIKELLRSGNLVIVPFVEENLQPASYDLTLSDTIRVFESHQVPYIDVRHPVKLTKEVKVTPEEGFIMHPGEFILGDTVETFQLGDDIVGVLQGRSSLGRLGLQVHATAGFVDPGFRGTITLEMTNVSRLPIKLYPGVRIAQMTFERTSTPVDRPYGTIKGCKYQDQRGPTESLIGEDFGPP